MTMDKFDEIKSEVARLKETGRDVYVHVDIYVHVDKVAWFIEQLELCDEVLLKDRGKTNEINILVKEVHDLEAQLEASRAENAALRSDAEAATGWGREMRVENTRLRAALEDINGIALGSPDPRLSRIARMALAALKGGG
jgi:uncharacterized protein YhaN